ncbi:hypothetical protein [Pseudomonas viridiflava]|uniref:hypothetical protein n=1 Tax=Pseudomonas viridiflava TaxID=33069 RepID=UPI001C2D9A8B|nr:hypothetical protein [Pseudomonas viridiflava]MBV1809854.1 hypothetical protein [Pseudomonas viridiflava]
MKVFEHQAVIGMVMAVIGWIPRPSDGDCRKAFGEVEGNARKNSAASSGSSHQKRVDKPAREDTTLAAQGEEKRK